MVAILVVLTILCCIGIDAAIQFTRARQRRDQINPETNPLAGFALQGVTLPEGLFMDAAHTWVAVRKGGKAQVGLDQFLTKAIGTIDEIQLPEVGSEIRKGEKLFTIRQGDRKIDLPSPIEGIVHRVNSKAANRPDMLVSEPYRQWICSLQPLQLSTDLKRLSIAEEAVAWINDEVLKFQEFITTRPVNHIAVGAVMQDGGVPADGVLQLMDNETWNLFAFEFVRVHAAH